MSAKTTVKFRTVYVTQAGFDFTPLKSCAREIRFVTSGLEEVGTLPETIRKNMAEFDPDLDALVAVGRSNAVLIAGMLVGEKFPGKELTLGIYQSKTTDERFYEWEKVRL